MQYISIVYLLIITGLVVWIAVLRRRESALQGSIEQHQREKEAVFLYLNNLGERLTASKLELDPALQVITDFVVDVTEAEAGATYIFEPGGEQLAAHVVYGLFPPLMPTTSYVLTKQKYLSDRVKRERIQKGTGIVGQVAETGQAILITDAANDPRVPKSGIEFLTIRSMLVAPLRIRGEVLGVLALINKKTAPAFTLTDLELLNSIADQAASTVDLVKLYADLSEVHRIEQELRIAHEFQNMLLPAECPQIDGYELAAFSQPAREVGGDYYDFFWVDSDRRFLGVVIADVSGKGIPGAFIMSMLRSVLRAQAHNNLSPRDVLLRTNERIYADTKENVFITVTYGILDVREREFRFVRAGHEPTVTVKPEPGAVQLTSPEGIALGMVDNQAFGEISREATLRLVPGELAVLYTDGVVEAMDADGNEYGQRRFYDFVAANRELSPGEIIEKTLQDIRSFTRDYPQHDDITLVALRVLEQPVILDMPAAVEAQA